MSNANKGGENRFFQLMIVIITAVVGPLTVYFVTNGSSKNNQASMVINPTAAVTVLAATSAETPTPLAQKTLNISTAVAPTESPSTANVIQNPKGTVPAGTQALMDNMALWIEPGSVQIDHQYIGLKIHIRNLGSADRTITYLPAALVMRDEQGKTYAAYTGDKKNQCKKSDIDVKRTLQIGAQQEIVLQSPDAAHATLWCSGSSNTNIPLFSGPIGKDTHVLRVEIKSMGPFQGFTIEIQL